MNDQDILDRFEELEVGRILGDLDPDEIKEWEQISKDPRCQTDLSLELTAAALEVDALKGKDTEMPDALLESLRKSIPKSETVEPESKGIVHPSAWQKILTDPKTGWAIAALFAVLFLAKSFVEKPPTGPNDSVAVTPPPPSPDEARNTLISKAGDLIQSEFGGTEQYGQMSGTVVWSDELQEGYMSLSNLPVNDPDTNQYQLWIVDPGRDEKPVDGGVFDISASDDTAIIPIRNPLVVTNPQAFVITLEQPGGVVVSKQEVVVALAKTS